MPQTSTQKNQPAPSRQRSSDAAPNETSKPTADHVYGLVSVLYHALQGAETYERYIDDAERAGDDELVRFFEQCRDEENDRATRAKRLLIERAEEEDEEEDQEDEDEE